MNDALGERMKEFEKVFAHKLPRKHHIIIRLDGKAFHTFTRGLDKPFDYNLINTMKETAQYLLDNVQNCKCAYVQSDEISLLLDDTATLETDCWFGNNIQKIVSISASMATAFFNKFWKEMNVNDRIAMFDSRVFILPKNDIANYFIWRQRDWNRNSIQMLTRSYYSTKEMYKKNTSDMHEMLHAKDINWANLDGHLKNGTLLFKDNEYTEKFDYDKFNELWSENGRTKS